MSADEPLLRSTGLTKRFSDKRTIVDKVRKQDPAVLTALDDVDLAVEPGETLGVVGESGSGKSTLARCIVRLHEPDGGSVEFDGVDVLAASGSELRAMRRSIQMVYQDPYASLNPRIRIGAAVAEPALVHGLVEKGGEERLRGRPPRAGRDPARETCAASRTSSPAASASGSRSPARWR